ncbi:preprotein translocase subunit SecY [Candidatus Woesearchaeota archaeon]|nr:preprotein translocase subunit SecY [Candidatus Woesearchaeota archaeon]
MSWFDNILNNLPEVQAPTQKKLGFKEKLKWTGAILILFFILGMIPLFGLGQNALEQFEYLSIILGAKFGSIISLGIGPIVTASIVLQLLQGSGLMKMDLSSHEGKKRFQGIQKILAVFFILFEAAIYVLMGGLAPAPQLAGTTIYLEMQLMLIFQLFIGGILIMFMDEVVSKWGFGSGISLFIAAGVSAEIFIRAFSPFASPNNPNMPSGAIPGLFKSLSMGDPTTAGILLSMVIATVVVFAASVYAQAMKIEIPLSFGRIRGYGIRWPLNFLYTSNIPVILTAALMANIQLWARLMQNWGYPIFGRFVGNTPVSGIVAWIHSPELVTKIITGSLSGADIMHSLAYLSFMVMGSIIFSWFWMQSAGMDAKSQAKQIMASGLQIPGFRKDERVLERLLDRYIKPLTVMGGIAIGILAALADLSGALGRGTGILLTVMIVYRLYEEIAKEHMMDMHPMMRRFME